MAKKGAEDKDKLSELALVECWRDRIALEVKAQLAYAREWGSLADEPPPTTLEGQIEAKKAELAALKRGAAAPPAFQTTTQLQQETRDSSLETFETFETDLDKSLAAVKGTKTRRGAAAKPSA